LLAAQFKQRRYLLVPWLREHENCMVYAASGVGKSLFALSAAMAVAGGGEFLGWHPEPKPGGGHWKVLYVDGEMHISDIQERVRLLRAGMPRLDEVALNKQLQFLARQHQDAGVRFPSITEQAGQRFVLKRIENEKIDLAVLDNFSTLGEVEDENAAASFNSIQQFLLQLKVQGVATMLVHHTGKAEDNFRGSSKLAATFETIIQLERPQVTYRKTNGSWEKRAITAVPGSANFRVRFDKVRSGSKTQPEIVLARLERRFSDASSNETQAVWEYEEAASTHRLDEIRQKLAAGEFQTQKEIGVHYDVSSRQAGKYIERGIKLGLWSKLEVSQWFAKGKGRRAKGETQAPARPDTSWENETLSDDPPTSDDPYDM
jgi:RecA-family ATPase